MLSGRAGSSGMGEYRYSREKIVSPRKWRRVTRNAPTRASSAARRSTRTIEESNGEIFTSSVSEYGCGKYAPNPRGSLGSVTARVVLCSGIVVTSSSTAPVLSIRRIESWEIVPSATRLSHAGGLAMIEPSLNSPDARGGRSSSVAPILVGTLRLRTSVPSRSKKLKR